MAHNKNNVTAEGQTSIGPKQNEPRCLAEGKIPWMASHIEWLETREITNPRGSLRTIPKKLIRQRAKCIEEHGIPIPILADEKKGLIAGEIDLLAAKLLDLDVVPVIRITHLNEEQIRVMRIAIHRFAELEEWDKPILGRELQSLVDLQVNIELTGFEIPEVDLLIQQELPKLHNQALDDCPPATPDHTVVTRIGDLWICGRHRVLCGNACNKSHMIRLMRFALAHALVTDSPYNLKIKGFVSGKGKHQHQDFLMAAGEMSDAEFLNFQTLHLKVAAAFLADGALAYSFMCWRSIDTLLAAGKAVFDDHLNICVWVKTNAGMGSLYRSQHELIAVFKHGSGPHRNNVQLGKYGRNRSNVMEYEGANSFNPERRKELALHPTVKPVRLIADIMLDCTAPNDIVLDPFLGSGTTVIAAEDSGRRAFGMELDPKYVDVIVRRWQELTGEQAILESTGQTFEEVARHGRGPLLLPSPAGCKKGGHDD